MNPITVEGLLTAVEADVLRDVAAGLTNKQIAAKQGRRVQMVDRHLTHVYAKLDVQGRGSHRVLAARWWWENFP